MTEKHTKKIKRSPEERFCSYCGDRMGVWIERADRRFMFYGEKSSIPIEHRYDKKTGKANYVYRYKCPRYFEREQKWYQNFLRNFLFPFSGTSPHDGYFLEDIFNL